MTAPRCRRELAQTIVIRSGEFLGGGFSAAAKGVEKIPSELAADRMNGIVAIEALVHQARQGLANGFDELRELRLDYHMNGCMQCVTGKCFVRVVVRKLLEYFGVRCLHEPQALRFREREPLFRVRRL